MPSSELSNDELIEICEDCFVTVKEACMRLQERTRCSNQVVIEMLKNLVEFYESQNKT